MLDATILQLLLAAGSDAELVDASTYDDQWQGA
jgi:hypothetical protein